MIVINRDKAECATRDRLRAAREPRLVELDIRFLRALEAGQEVGAIVTEKQALRDVTEKKLGSLTIDQLSLLTVDDALALP